MSTLTVRFMGICCFVNSWGLTKSFEKRVLLPVNNRASERTDGSHIPYLELDILDEPRVTGRFTREATYTREGRTYRRYHLSGDRIRIANAVRPPNPLNVLSTYRERVPSLTALTPGLSEHLAPEFFTATPPRDKVAAYFDIQFGDLHTGPSTIFPIRFDEPSDPAQPRRPAGRLASWIELQIPIEENEGPVIEVESFDGSGGTRTIRLSEMTDCVTIANQLEADITRQPFDPGEPRDEDFRAHFSLYYDLYANVPDNAARPTRTFAAVNGCVGSQIP